MIDELETSAQTPPDPDGVTSGATNGITVAIVDEHDVVHAGIQAWCTEADTPITVVGTFCNPLEFLARYPDLPNEVDVVVMDLHRDGERPSFDMLRRMCRAGQRVVVYSQLAGAEVILTCLELGAVTYLTKTEGRDHLIDAVRAACSEEPYLGPQMAKALLHDRSSGRINLSDREKEVLVTWFQTESKDLVADRLYIAPTTVRTHLQRARAKYAAAGRLASTKAALLARAVEDGILSLGEL